MGDNKTAASKGTPFFSIVIPAYNVEKYLEECIESISRQSFRDFEVVVVDDGSKDNTPAICDTLPEKFPQMRIKVRHQPNQGQVTARMNGISATEGAYLMIIDSDDKLTPNALEVVKAAIDKWDADITLYSVIRFWEGGSARICPHFSDQPCYMAGDDYKKFLKLVSITNSFGSPWSRVYRRQVITNAKKMKIPSSIRMLEDCLMSLPWYDMARSAVYIPEDLYLYRLNLESISFTFHHFDSNPLSTALFFYNTYLEYINKWKLEDAGSFLQRFFLTKAGFVVNYVYEHRYELSFKEKKAYFTELMNNEVFRKEIKGYRGSGMEGPIKLIILKLLYLKLWRIALFITEHDQKLDRKLMAQRAKK